MRLPALLICALLALGSLPSATASPLPQPIVISHRGGADIFPENTLAAFKGSISLGVPMIELDTRLTSDGQVVVMHDPTLDRTTNCTGPVISKTLAEVTACDASRGWPAYAGRSDARVPSLRQVVDLLKEHPTLLADIEIASYPGEADFHPERTDHTNAVMKIIEPVADRVTIQSFWPPYLERAHMLRPTQAIAIITGFSAGSAYQTAHNGMLYTIARDFRVAEPDSNSPDLTKEYVELAHASGRKVFVWTVNDEPTMLKLIGLGVDGIITDRPDVLLRLTARA